MTPALDAVITAGVAKIEVTPAIPAVFLPLIELLNAPPDQVNLDKIVELVSFDSTITAQCLRVASSPLFGMSRAPQSIKAVVISLGLRRVETILLTCCLSNAFPARNWVIDPAVFWRHSLGCAMVCRKFAEKLKAADTDEAYMAGLLHDIGILVNCQLLPEEFSRAMAHAVEHHQPLVEAELAIMGCTHEDTGMALGRRWHLNSRVVQAIGHHHGLELCESAQPLAALVHLSDLLCRVRGLGYGYREDCRVDLAADSAWQILRLEYRELDAIDLVRFTFELDDCVIEVQSLVDSILGPSAKAASSNI